MGLTKFSKVGFYYFLCCFVFLGVSLIYFLNITMVFLDQYSIDSPFSGYANYHDHFVYKSEVMRILDGQFKVSDFSPNVTGIAIIYYLANLAFPVSFEVSSFFLNVIVLSILLLVYYSLCRFLNLSSIYFFLIFSLVYFIYLAQLAGKDIFYALFILLFLRLALERSYLKIILLSIVFGLFVRVQAVVLLSLFLVYFLAWISYGLRLFVVYVAASVVGVLVTNSVLGEGADLGGGVANLLNFINKYYIGNLLLNPVRLVQYIYEFIRFPFYYSRLVDFLLVPLIIVFILTLSRACHVFSKNIVSFFFFCLLMTLLVVPIVNLRYFILVFPIYFLLLGLGVRGKIFA